MRLRDCRVPGLTEFTVMEVLAFPRSPKGEQTQLQGKGSQQQDGNAMITELDPTAVSSEPLAAAGRVQVQRTAL